MARTAIPVTNITTTAAAPASEVTGDTTDGHYITHAAASGASNTFVVVRNADSGGAHTVTIGLVARDGQAVTGKTVSVPASSTRQFRLGHPTNYGTRTNLNVDSTQLKLTAYKLA